MLKSFDELVPKDPASVHFETLWKLPDSQITLIQWMALVPALAVLVADRVHSTDPFISFHNALAAWCVGMMLLVSLALSIQNKKVAAVMCKMETLPTGFIRRSVCQILVIALPFTFSTLSFVLFFDAGLPMHEAMKMAVAYLFVCLVMCVGDLLVLAPLAFLFIVLLSLGKKKK